MNREKVIMKEIPRISTCILGILLVLNCSEQFSSQNQDWRKDLSGTWFFRIDSLDIGITEKWFLSQLSSKIKLPGSMVENGYGSDISIATKWTGQIVDKSWYDDEKYEKYRQYGTIKIPFWFNLINSMLDQHGIKK